VRLWIGGCGLERVCCPAVNWHGSWSWRAASKNSRAGVMLGYGAIPTARIEEGLCLLQACFDA